MKIKILNILLFYFYAQGINDKIRGSTSTIKSISLPERKVDPIIKTGSPVVFVNDRPAEACDEIMMRYGY